MTAHSHTQRTQMERVQAMLLNGRVCATTFHQYRIPAGRNRVSELRADGWAIETHPCSQGHNHETHQIEYRLVHGPGCLCPWCRTAAPQAVTLFEMPAQMAPGGRRR